MSTAYAFDDVRRPAVPVRFATVGATARPLLPEPEREPVVADAPAAASPAIEAAPLRAARPRVLVAVGLAGGVACVLAAQLLLSISTASGAYRVASLQTESTTLARQQQVATEQLEQLGAPQHLAREAQSLGMVPSTGTAYLRLSDGATIGAGRGGATGSRIDTARVPDALLPSH
jgi:hypothetical protein